MKIRTRLLAAALLLAAASNPAQAQRLWTSADLSFGLTKNLTGSVQGEYRTQDRFDGPERWTASASADYRIHPQVKLTAQYMYFQRYFPEETTDRGTTLRRGYNRAAFAITGSQRWDAVTLSLRERYQYTCLVGDAQAAKHVLHATLRAEYTIRDCKLKPYGSAELYNRLSDFGYDESRFTAGAVYSFTRHYALDLYYRYIDASVCGGHFLGVGCHFKL